MSAPTPSLSYSRLREHGSGVRSTGPNLDEVNDVRCYLDADGFLRVTVSGPMRRRDGSRGRQHRSASVVVRAQQPEWLAEIIADARRRLEVRDV